MPSFDREDTISDAIERILDAIERAEPGERPLPDESRRSGRPFDLDYGFAVDWGLDPIIPVDPGGPDSPPESNEHLVDSRREDDEITIVADLPDADGDDVEVRLDEDARLLEIRDADGVIERTALPWPAEVRTVRLNNAVLDVRIGRLDPGVDDE
jgi:HSP20 family molecular chaperone IbpA